LELLYRTAMRRSVANATAKNDAKANVNKRVMAQLPLRALQKATRAAVIRCNALEAPLAA